VLSGGRLFERDHFYDYQIVILFHFTETTGTIVVVFVCLYFFCLAISVFPIRPFLHVLHIALLNVSLYISYSAFKLQVCSMSQFSSVAVE